MLSKVYKCPFVEISALLSMNIEQLWSETLCKLQKQKIMRERILEQGIEDDPETMAAAIAANSTPNTSRRRRPNHNSSRIVGRIMNRTRRFAKSCEELVARFVTTM